MLKTILIIGTGSFLGGVLRYLVSLYVQNNVLSAFPWGTFIVNILGSLLIGFLFGLSERLSFFDYEWRLFLAVGFCGSFTTFSTFANENLALLKEGSFFLFAVYTGLTIFLGLLAVFSGSLISKTF